MHPKNKKTKNWLDQKLFWIITPAHMIIFVLMGLSLGLHLFNIGSIGNANQYYTAAVKSMLQSWDNFFFAAAEPGGSVTVDKPPLGLWIETIFAYVLGVSGYSVSLPNIISGILSVPLIFILTRKYSNSIAGIVAATSYTFTPIVLAANRNNTIDGMLVFTLLLAAWAFIKATDTGNFGYLIAGSVLLGLGFNIKMLQAYLVLPAFLLLFLLGSKIKWGKRILFSGISLLVILAVSLTWVIIVDLIPPEERPYIGSSENNTVMELIIGHNGLNRLFGGRKNQATKENLPKNGPQFPTNPGQGNNPPMPNQQLPGPLPGNEQDQQIGQNPDQVITNSPGGKNAFNNETGSPGIFRLFQAPLGKEMSWLLPFALASMVMMAFTAPLSFDSMSGIHKSVILWGGWLLTCVIFFSMAEFFHAYYMIMLAPPMAALAGTGFARMIDNTENTDWKVGAFVSATLLTLVFQIYLGMQYIDFSFFMFASTILFILAAAILLFVKKVQQRRILGILLLASILLIPAWWSFKTVADDTPHAGLPSAYSGERPMQQPRLDDSKKNAMQIRLIDFLMDKTEGMKYLVAVSRANSGAPFVLETGRPVLYMGGFSGSDPVVNVSDLQTMVAKGDLRYFFYENMNQENDPEVRVWLRESCRIVPAFSAKDAISDQPNPKQVSQQPVLFDCNPSFIDMF